MSSNEHLFALEPQRTRGSPVQTGKISTFVPKYRPSRSGIASERPRFAAKSGRGQAQGNAGAAMPAQKILISRWFLPSDRFVSIISDVC
jgi:hypothetical protein